MRRLLFVLMVAMVAGCGGDDEKLENCDFCCTTVDPPSGCTTNESQMACPTGKTCSPYGNPR